MRRQHVSRMWGLCRICIRTYRARTRHRVLLCYPSKNISPSGVWQPRNDTPLGTSPHCSQLGQAQTLRHPSHSAQRPAGISAGRSRDLLTHERGDRPVRLRVASGCFFLRSSSAAELLHIFHERQVYLPLQSHPLQIMVPVLVASPEL